MADEEEAPPAETEEPPPSEENDKKNEGDMPKEAEEPPPSEEEDNPKKNKGGKAGPTNETITELEEKRKQVQYLNNAIKNLRCQEIFSYKNKKNGPVTEDMIASMKTANCDFLRNFNDMWGKTQEILSDLELSRIMSRELSYVPSSVVGLHTKVTRSESFEKLNSKKLPRVIVCGNEKSQMVPRIIVCEDKNVTIPGGDCMTVQEVKPANSNSKISNYTSYGGKYCS